MTSFSLPRGAAVPSKMVHEAWTTCKEGALLFITVDAAWDNNWVNGPPMPQALLADMPRAARQAARKTSFLSTEGLRCLLTRRLRTAQLRATRGVTFA